ncbi:hypothetical protein INT46_005489 [Mucor plumbeus]|uniref:FAR1 domain-containing protein n=1 Tax=Mucor plumbeus TaxID=97098 RepID=A0A8H7UUT8_9FUNG|nr:hypothetical protein INT46_005489 [Mucor plumbeus]
MTEELSFIRDSLTQMLEHDRHNDELIKVRQNFDSINDIRQAAIRYARRHKFAVSTLRSGARQLVLVCKHSGAYRATKPKIPGANESQSDTPEEVSNELQQSTLTQESAEADPSTPKKGTRKKLSQKIQCPFEIRAKPMGSSWIIYKINYEHNHEMATDIKAYAQHRKLSQDTRQLIIDLMNSGSTNTTILEYLQLKGIDNVLKKDIANIRQAHFNNKSKKGKQVQKPQQFLHVKLPEQQTLKADSVTFQPSLQYPEAIKEESLPAGPNDSQNTVALIEKSSPNDNIEQKPSTITTTDQTQTQQTTEGEQLYHFISQNNVQVN